MASFTAYVEVVTPESRYWNPINGTEADSVAACELQLDAWIERRVATSGGRFPTPESVRARRRFQINPTPAHAVGKYREGSGGDRAPTFNINGVGFKGGNVPAVEAGLMGFYHGGKPWTPDPAAIRALLPYRWRVAFDRAGAFSWDRHNPRRAAYLALYDRSGRRHLTTVYAHAVTQEESA